MKVQHTKNCKLYADVLGIITYGPENSFISAPHLRLLMETIKPCGACCSITEQEKSHLSGRIYKPQAKMIAEMVIEEGYSNEP